MQNSSIIIRYANPSDAGAIADTAIEVWMDTYQTDTEALKKYVRTTFTAENFLKIIKTRQEILLAAEDAGKMIGFALLSTMEKPGDLKLPDPVEISKFYILKKYHGTGTASLMMDFCITEARHKGYKTLWLSVYEENHRAIRYYEKTGFRQAGEYPFEIDGEIYMNKLMLLSI